MPVRDPTGDFPPVYVDVEGLRAPPSRRFIASSSGI